MNSNKNHYLTFDISNMLYRTFYANPSHDVDLSAGLAHHTALTTLNKYYKIYRPHKIFMTFDRHSWRKDYTADEELCLSGKKYKGNRRKKQTAKDKEKYGRFLEHLTDFENIMRERTSIICLAGDGLEADDLMAGVCQLYPDDKHTIVSGDKDMIQLLRNENVDLVDPATGKSRTLNEWDNSADLFMFEKCLRGDSGDNVGSSFPRVRSKKIREAFEKPYERVNMMNECWNDQNGLEQVVRHLFAENELLMDLTKQPDCIRRKMFEEIEIAMEDPGAYSHFHFLKFCGKYDLKKISQSIENFVPMLSR